MAKPFTFSTKRAGGNIYVQFALPDGGRTFQKSTGTSNRKEAEKIAMEWLVNVNIPERINSAKPYESKLNMDKLALFNNLKTYDFEEYMNWLNNWNENHGHPMQILNWALHQDEQGAPHFHLRRVWMHRDEETGLLSTGQEEALKLAGVELPEPNKKEGRRNNRKKTFDKMCREKWIQISRQHGLEIEDTPKPKDQVGLPLEDFQKQKDGKRNDIYQKLVELANENMAALKKISEWEFLGPKVERFEKWLENEFFYYDTGTAEEKNLIKKQIVSAFANSTKAIQDKFTEQIAEYQRQLEEKKPEQQIKRKDIGWER